MTSIESNPSPRLQATTFSRFFHIWLSSLLDRSHEQETLHLKDLYDLTPDFESSKLTTELETKWLDEVKRNGKKASLIRATIRATRWEFFLCGLFLIPFEGLNIAQPFLLRYLIKYFQPCSTVTTFQAWMLVVGLLVTLFLSKLLLHQYIYRVVLCGVRMRVAYAGLVFQKVLRLSSSALHNFSTGEMTNLIANDAPKVELIHYFLHYLWVAPLQVTTVIFILWQFIHYITLIAVGYTFLLLIIQPISSRLFIHLRSKVLKITDQRVKTMSEIIKSMRIVKMYCWESAFERRIRQIRKREIVQTALFLLCSCVDNILSHTYLNMVFLMMYGTMWALNTQFDTGFFAISFVILTYTRQSTVNSFNFTIRDVVNYMAAQKRIRRFLLLDETERDLRLFSPSTEHLPSAEIESQVICSLKEARWDETSRFILKNVVFEAHPGDLICIIGPVGSGKSSLLQTLSGEIPQFDGKVRLHGSFCFVPQESWVFSSSIKTNILFGKDYNSKLFQRVIHATALDIDFIQLPHGANTLVGDQGVMLSGGQKARVNLARALYRDADIYLLDDPLSAVDTKVSKHLFDESIKKYLREKVCILVTHQIQFLQDATKIIVLNQGEMVQMGTYNELLESSESFAQLLEDIHQHEREQQQQYQQQESTILSPKRTILGSISSERDDEDEHTKSLSNVEIKQQGHVGWYVYFAYLRAGVNIVVGVLLILILFSSQQILSFASNWWLAAWSEDESHRHRHENSTHCLNDSNSKIDHIRQMSESEWKTYRDRRFWTFFAMVMGFFLLACIRILIIRLICLNAGRVLHNQMFQRVIRAPIAFFDLNPVGRILNRFTSDVASLDDSLSNVVADVLICISQVLGTIILVGLINPWAFIPAFIAAIGMLFVRHRFASCSRDLKRLGGVTRSPLYSQLTSTISGLKVIRSFRAESICSKQFLNHLNDNTRVEYLIVTLNRWSALRFDLVSMMFVVLVTCLAMMADMFEHKLSAADIALTITYSLSLMGIFQWTIRQSVEVETQMTSVERVLEYCALDQEPPAHLPSPPHPHVPPHWPSHGHILFDHVSMSHSQASTSFTLALRDLSLNIQPREKIGIVGRTGAGKSSFIQTLFRLGTIVDGHIIIDDIDIATIGLDEVRRRLSIIPQDPVLFTGTIRNNLDPFGDYSDAEIWQALEQVQLKRLVTEVMRDGLQSTVSESGSNLSVGQKQLVCLARAILKKSKVLVIDEATANVDNATDELIQQSIREQFKACTVLTVAHRLRTVIDSDRIMVLDHGRLVEFDHPHVLLSNGDSYFSRMVEQTGATEAEHLRTLANTKQVYSREQEEFTTIMHEVNDDLTETDALISHGKAC